MANKRGRRDAPQTREPVLQLGAHGLEVLRIGDDLAYLAEVVARRDARRDLVGDACREQLVKCLQGRVSCQ